ncbi:MAG: alpha/beta hydrolase [Thaumarchaeota archaeon]|nr:alpha/beta hydrolase [Nitrososphaerota archaeon]
MSKVDVGGVSLYYEETGIGQPVVFVHGIPTDCRAWGAQVEPFSKGRRMLAVSRRYAAPNQREGDVSDSTVQNNAADLKGFIEKVAEGPVDLVGHSYGGFISAFLAADHPDLVRNLVLVEPAISTLLVADQTSNAQSLGLLLRSPSVALSGRRFQTKSLGPSLKALDGGQKEKAVELNVDGVQDSEGAFRRLSEGARKMMLDNARTIAELRTKFPRFTAKEAGRISAPTMVVNGQESALWLRRIGELTAMAVPKARRVTVPGARHYPHMENPEVFNSNVLDFLVGKGKQ